MQVEFTPLNMYLQVNMRTKKGNTYIILLNLSHYMFCKYMFCKLACKRRSKSRSVWNTFSRCHTDLHLAQTQIFHPNCFYISCCVFCSWQLFLTIHKTNVCKQDVNPRCLFYHATVYIMIGYCLQHSMVSFSERANVNSC